MDDKSVAPCRTARAVSADNVSASRANHQEYWRRSAAPISSRNPLATVTEGLDITTSAALARPSSARNYRALALLHGPLPQKGSGQERFLQMLKKGHLVNPPMIAQGRDLPTLSAGAIQRADSIVPTPRDAEEQVPSITNKEIKIKRSDSCEPRQKPRVTAYRGGRQAMNCSSAIARLSMQCQLRHFNPKWHVTLGPRGFTCSVQIIDEIIYGDHAHKTPDEAKQHVAEKALIYVCGLPCKDPAEKVVANLQATGHIIPSIDRYRSGRPREENTTTVSAGHVSHYAQHTRAAPTAANAAAYDRHAQNYHEYDEQGTFIRNIKSVLGETGLGPSVLSDPFASQAFLQGLAVGTASVRTAGSAYDPPLELRRRLLPAVVGDLYRPDYYTAREQSPAPNSRHDYMARERSPAPNPSRNYRERSPVLNPSRDYQAQSSPRPRRGRKTQRSSSRGRHSG